MGMSSTTQFGPRQSREASFEAEEKEATKSRVAISLFFFGRSGRRIPEKTKKNANGRKDGDDELRNGQRRNSLDEGDVLRAVVCDYVGPRGVCRNAEAGHTAAVASKTEWVACHTGPQRRMVRAATPAECLVGRTGGGVPRAQRSAGAGWRSRASQSNLASRRPL